MSREQSLKALEVADRVRSDRAQFKRKLRTKGRTQAANMAAKTVLSPPDWMATMMLKDLLLATPGVGIHRVKKLTRNLSIGPNIRLQNLSPKTRHEIAQWLGSHANGPSKGMRVAA